MLEFKEIVHKLKIKLKELFENETKDKKKSQLKSQNLQKSTMKVTDITQDKVEDKDTQENHQIEDVENPDSVNGNSNSLSYGTFEDCPCASKCGEVAAQVQKKLRSAQDAKLHSQLMLPKDLLGRLSHDVVKMSQCEPRGVRGCVLYMNLERKDMCIPLGDVSFESNSLATFELYVTLMEEKTRWSGFLRILRTLFLPCHGPSFQSKIFISPGYQMIKKKLYKAS